MTYPELATRRRGVDTSELAFVLEHAPRRGHEQRFRVTVQCPGQLHPREHGFDDEMAARRAFFRAMRSSEGRLVRLVLEERTAGGWSVRSSLNTTVAAHRSHLDALRTRYAELPSLNGP